MISCLNHCLSTQDDTDKNPSLPPVLFWQKKLGGSGPQNKGVCNLIATMQLKPATFGIFWQLLASDAEKYFQIQ